MVAVKMSFAASWLALACTCRLPAQAAVATALLSQALVSWPVVKAAFAQHQWGWKVIYAPCSSPLHWVPGFV